MQMMDELQPLRLYSSKRKVYIPFNTLNKKKGARIELLTKDLKTSSELMNLPYIYNPNLFSSYYMTRNVMAYVDSRGIVDDTEEEDDEIESIAEAVMHKSQFKQVYIDTDGTPTDRKLLTGYFSTKNIKDCYELFGKPGYAWPALTVYGFNSVAQMAKAVNGQAIIQNGELVINSYNSTNEIFVLNQSAFSEIKEQEVDYEMYCKNALITYVVMNVYDVNRRWANYVGSAISGQAVAIKDYYVEKDRKITDDISIALTLSKIYEEEGIKPIRKLLRTGNIGIIGRYKAYGTLDMAKKLLLSFKEEGDRLYKPSDENFYKNKSPINELATIPDNKIVVGTDFHFVGYNDDKTKIIIKPKSYIDKVIEKQNELVGNDGIFIFLGDLFYKSFTNEYDIPAEMKKEAIEAAKRLKGKYKILIRGNHDKLPDEFYIKECGFTHVCASLTYGNILFTHQPEIVKDPMINVHGHLHGVGLYVEGKPQNYMDVYVVNKCHVDTLPNILSKREEYEKTIKQASDIDRADPHQFIPGNRLSLEEIIDGVKNESTLLESVTDKKVIKSFIDSNNIHTAQQLFNWMKSNITYNEFDSILLDINEFLKRKKADCHTQSYFESQILKALGYKCKVYLAIEWNDQGQGGETHSFVIYEDKGKKYWFENAWSDNAGIHQVNSDKFIEEFHKTGRWGNKKNFPNFDVSTVSLKPGMSLQDIVSGNSVNESALFESDGNHMDCVRVYKAMNHKDQEYLAGGYDYVAMPNKDVIYRHVIRDGIMNIKGFVEVTADIACEQSMGKTGSVIIGVHPRHRREGLGKELISTMLKELPKEHPEVSNLVYRVAASNKASMKLAEKMGFKMVRKTEAQTMYRYYFKEEPDYKYLDSKVLNDNDLVKYMKSFKFTGDVDAGSKVRSIKDIARTKSGNTLDAAMLTSTYLNKLGLGNAIGCLVLMSLKTKEVVTVHFFNVYSYNNTNWYVLDCCTDKLRGNISGGETNPLVYINSYTNLYLNNMLPSSKWAKADAANGKFIGLEEVKPDQPIIGLGDGVINSNDDGLFTESALNWPFNRPSVESNKNRKIKHVPLPNSMISEQSGMHTTEKTYVSGDNFIIDEGDGIAYLFDNDEVMLEANKAYDQFIRRYLYKERLKNNKALIEQYNTVKQMNPIIKKTYTKISNYGKHNLFIDYSYYNGIFLAKNKKIKDYGVKMYWDFITRLLNLPEEITSVYTKSTIYIPVYNGAWDIAPKSYVWDYRKNINPISVIFRMLKTNPAELANVLGNRDVIFLSHKGYFKIDFKTFEYKKINRLKYLINRLWNEEDISEDEDEDGYDNTDIDTDTPAVIATKIAEKLEKNSGITLDDLSAVVKDPESIGIKTVEDIPILRIRSYKIPIINNTTNQKDADIAITGVGVGVLSPTQDQFVDVISKDMMIDNKNILQVAYIP